MSFNDYLKYVKGHSVDVVSLSTALPDRINTAIKRRMIEAMGGPNKEYTSMLILIDEVFTDNYTITLKSGLFGRNYKIFIDLDEYSVLVKNSTKTYNEDNIFEDPETGLVTKTKSTYFINLDDIYDAGEDTEVCKYIKEGIDKIGKINIDANIITIAVINLLERAGYFKVSNGTNFVSLGKVDDPDNENNTENEPKEE